MHIIQPVGISSLSIAGLSGKAHDPAVKGSGHPLRKYDFTYDNTNRLTRANFKQYAGSFFNNRREWTAVSAACPMMRMAISCFIMQKGLLVNSSATIDSLVYGYYNNGNRLKGVMDSGDAMLVLKKYRKAPRFHNTSVRQCMTADFTWLREQASSCKFLSQTVK